MTEMTQFNTVWCQQTKNISKNNWNDAVKHSLTYFDRVWHSLTQLTQFDTFWHSWHSLMPKSPWGLSWTPRATLFKNESISNFALCCIDCYQMFLWGKRRFIKLKNIIFSEGIKRNSQILIFWVQIMYFYKCMN